MASETSATVGRSARTTRRTQRTQAAPPAHPWTDQAPARLANCGHPRDEPAAWQAWQKHLVKRRGPEPLEALCEGKVHPLLWNLPDDVDAAALCEILSIAASKNGKAERHADRITTRWIETDQAGVDSSVDPLTDLALAHILPAMAGRLAADRWWDLLDTLGRRCNERRTGRLDENAEGRIAWCDQVLSGELPLTLACQFPELRACSELAALAQEILTDGLVRLTDGEGLLHARHLPWLRPLLACWTRCLATAEDAGLSPWGEDAQVQYEWLVRQALRLTRSDGTQLFGHSRATDWDSGLVGTALELAGDDEDVAAAEMALPGDLRLSDAEELPCEPSLHSEWSQLAVLRTGWQRSAPRLAVDYSGPEISFELETGREVVLAGVWELDVVANGRRLERDETWEELCWFSDDDVDYLELSADLAGGGRIDRQILLAREDHFLFLNDNVVNVPAGGLECTTRVPVAEGLELVPEQETREATLIGRKPRAVAIPLALTEWRIDPRHGEFETDGRHLQLRQSTAARSLASPLFLDLAPRRLQKPRTWRQLTVAQSREICPRETAVAYRVQCGMAQWIFYRSLAPPDNRTFFGQNVSSEFFAARFHRDGEVEELLEIE